MLTAKQLAARLGVCVDTVYRLLQAGRLTAVNVGTGHKRPRWAFDESAARAALERREAKASRL